MMIMMMIKSIMMRMTFLSVICLTDDVVPGPVNKVPVTDMRNVFIMRQLRPVRSDHSGKVRGVTWSQLGYIVTCLQYHQSLHLYHSFCH